MPLKIDFGKVSINWNEKWLKNLSTKIKFGYNSKYTEQLATTKTFSANCVENTF